MTTFLLIKCFLYLMFFVFVFFFSFGYIKWRKMNLLARSSMQTFQKKKKKISDGQVQVLLTRCHTAAAGEVRGGDVQRLRGGEPVFFSLPDLCIFHSLACLSHTHFTLDVVRCIHVCISFPYCCSSFELWPFFTVNSSTPFSSLVLKNTFKTMFKCA